MKRIITLIILFSISICHCQLTFEFKKKNKLQNWEVNIARPNAQNSYAIQDEQLIFNGDYLDVWQKSKFEGHNKEIVTLSFKYLIHDPYVKEYNDMSFGIICTKASKPFPKWASSRFELFSFQKGQPIGIWNNVEKSFYLEELLAFRIYLTFLGINNFKIHVKDFEVKFSPKETYFGNNLIANGGFELFLEKPKAVFNGLHNVAFWQLKNVLVDSLITRNYEGLYENAKINSFYYGTLDLGSPDLIYKNITSAYDQLNVPEGEMCARLYCPNLNLQRKGELLSGEYLQTKILHRLEKGEIYKLSMYLRLDVSSAYTFNTFGAFLSDKPLNVFDSLMFQHNLHKTEHLLLQEKLTKESWLKVSTEIVANGNEEYITIGCFDTNMIKYASNFEGFCKNCEKLGPIVLIDDIRLVKQ